MADIRIPKVIRFDLATLDLIKATKAEDESFNAAVLRACNTAYAPPPTITVTAPAAEKPTRKPPSKPGGHRGASTSTLRYHRSQDGCPHKYRNAKGICSACGHQKP